MADVTLTLNPKQQIALAASLRLSLETFKHLPKVMKMQINEIEKPYFEMLEELEKQGAPTTIVEIMAKMRDANGLKGQVG